MGPDPCYLQALLGKLAMLIHYPSPSPLTWTLAPLFTSHTMLSHTLTQMTHLPPYDSIARLPLYRPC